jgi:hypothetical protein
MLIYKEENFLREFNRLMVILKDRKDYKIVIAGAFYGEIQDTYGKTIYWFNDPEDLLIYLAFLIDKIDNDKGFVGNILERIKKAKK